MAPAAPTPEETAKFTESFARISLEGVKAKEALKNAKQARAIEDCITSLDLGPLDQKTLTLFLAACAPGIGADLPDEKRRYVVKRIIDGSLSSADRVSVACKYIAKLDGVVDAAAFDEECGVGVTVDGALIKAKAKEAVDALPADTEPSAGWTSMGAILGKLKSAPEFKWASSVDLKTEVEAALEARFGDKAAAIKANKEKQAAALKAAKAAKAAKPAEAAAPVEIDPDAMFRQGFLGALHKPGENPQKDPALKEQHLAATGGRVFTRFPPEPNGFLHIGHTKAIAIDFGYARYHKGLCYLRFDDTNPEAEEQIYFDAILEMVRWLGFEPWKITYSSDYFDQLYALAVELIKRGKAYVDHSTPEEIKAGRGGEERGPRIPSRWRERPVEESLKEFEDMRNGKYKAGTVTLRMKQDIEGSGNPQMWDLIAYRVLDAPHHRTGTKWCIYPTYDFTHCLVDSFENISHSLCTTEFILSRESYEWLCDALDVYKPRQYEFGRLALEGTLTSKRKILELVTGKHVSGWDDPRLYTLLALRRRGIPPGAILSFINQLGVTTATTTIQAARLDQAVRQYLESTTPRLMMVLKPLRVVLENVPDEFVVQVEKPLHPKVPAMGSNLIPFAKVVYVDASDWRSEDSPDYFRLAPGKTVGLLNAPFPVTVTGFKAGASGEADEVTVRYEDPAFGGDDKLKPKSYIQWVAEHAPSGSPVIVDEARIFHPLFTIDNPAGEKEYLKFIDPNSLEVHPGAMLEVGFWGVARQAFAEARKEAEERTVEAKAAASKADEEERAAVEAGQQGAVATGEGAPERTADQLIGNECVRFQGMRIAYFALDKESSLKALLSADDKAVPRKAEGEKLILNRIVSLKEDKAKEAAKPAAKGKKN